MADITLANILAGVRDTTQEQMIGGEPPLSQWSWEFQKPLFQNWLRNSLETAPLALPGRAPIRTLRGMHEALQPLTAAELEMAEAYRRILEPRPLKGLGPQQAKPPASEPPAPRQSDPPSFYDMWTKR